MSIKTLLKRIPQLIGGIGLIYGIMHVTPTPVFGQSPEWAEPISLSLLQGEQYGWFPAIIADATGRVHVVWSSALTVGEDNRPIRPTDNGPNAQWEGYDVVMYTSSQDGREWSQVKDIVALPSQGAVTRAAMLIDRQGIFHMTFRNLDIYYSHAPVQSVSSPKSWLPPSLITQTGYYTRMILDSQNRLHLVFTKDIYDKKNTDCPGCSDIFYRWSDDNGLTWSSALDISNLPTGSVKPQMVVDQQDNLYVIWEEGPGAGGIGMVNDPTKIMYTVSYDRGNTWAPPTEFIAPNGMARNSAIGIDKTGKLLITWLGLPEDVVYYQTSGDQGRSWSPPRPIPGLWGGWTVYNTKLDGSEMTADNAGDLHLVLVGRTANDQKSLSVLHLSWNGSVWSEPDPVTTLLGDVPEWPRMAISEGNVLNVVWFVRPKAQIWTGGGDYQIWYARGSSSAPAIAPVEWPTSTPTPISAIAVVATPTLASTVTPSPTPTLDPSLLQVSIPDGANTSIYSDNDEVLLLAQSLLPAILIIVIVVATVRFWRR